MTQLPTPDETMVDQILLEAHTISEDILYRHTNQIVPFIAQDSTEIRDLIVRQSQTIRRLQSELAAANARADAEYARGVKDCGQICKSWVECFGGRKIIHTTAQQYATDAMNDVIDLMHALLPNSKKEPHDAT
jgi:hypothetical protein